MPTTWQIVGLGVIQAIVLAAITGVISWASAQQAAKIKRDEKAQEWARQDEVADRVEAAARQTAEAARLLLESQEATTAATKEVARLAAESDAKVMAGLQILQEGNEKIHTLVNSDMTAARTAERDAVTLTLLALRRVQAMSAKLGLESSEEELEAIVRFEQRIVELDRILADRLAAQHRVDEEAARDHATAIGKRQTDPTGRKPG
jgi:hypothetical protein